MPPENIYQKKKIKMPKPILLLLLFVANSSFAQNNLEYYINTAKQNSPLVNDSKNQSKANQFDIERLKAFYTKPQIGITANYLFSPIISTDNNKTSFQPNAEGATNYYGYDLYSPFYLIQIESPLCFAHFVTSYYYARTRWSGWSHPRWSCNP